MHPKAPEAPKPAEVSVPAQLAEISRSLGPSKPGGIIKESEPLKHKGQEEGSEEDEEDDRDGAWSGLDQWCTGSSRSQPERVSAYYDFLPLTRIC
jgi:hypothetical protein